MPVYPAQDLNNQLICDSYPKLLQVYNNDIVLDGTGSQKQFLDITASYALNCNCGSSGGSEGYWGSFWDTNTQTNLTASNVMQLNNTDPNSNGVSIEQGSRIKFNYTGVYNIQFSAVFNRTSGANPVDINVWFAKTGSALVDSNTILSIAGQTNAVAAWNYVLKMNAGEYVEIYWHSNAANVSMFYAGTQSNPDIPATPSLIVTATQVANLIDPLNTGSFYPITSSWSNKSTNSISASYSLRSTTSSYALNGGTRLHTGSSYPITSSYSNNSKLFDNKSIDVFATTGSNTFTNNQTVTNGFVILSKVSSSLNFADDIAAAAGGVPLGGLYRNGNFILIRIT